MEPKSHEFNNFIYNVKIGLSGRDIEIAKKDEEPYKGLLYKYYGLSNNSIEALQENYIYASHPKEFNDPYDCYKDLISYENCDLNTVLKINDNFFDVELIKKYFYSKDSNDKIELYKRLHYMTFNRLYINTGIVCLTNNINSVEMWGHYSSHKGFGIKFDPKGFPKPNMGPFPINYSSVLEGVDYMKLEEFSFLYQASVKSIHWKPENEYRILFFSKIPLKIPGFDMPGSRDRKLKYDPKSVKEIILGFAFFDDNEIDIAKSNQVRAYIQLKKNRKRKRKVLYHALKNNIPVSWIRQNSVEYGFKPFNVSITQETCNKYIIDFITS